VLHDNTEFFNTLEKWPMRGLLLFLFLLLRYLLLNKLYNLFIWKTRKSSSIVYDFYHCAAVVVDQICNIEGKFLGVSLEWFFPHTCTGL